MRLFTTIIFSISLLVSLEGNCQRDMEDNRRWLNRQLSKHSNLVVLNSTGFNEWMNIINKYTPQGYILGYFVKDSFFIYHPQSSSNRKESCTGVMSERMEMFGDSIKPYCQYAEYQLFKKANFWNYDPEKAVVPTLIIIFPRSHLNFKKFLKQTDQYCKEMNMPYILFYPEFAVDY